MKKLTLFFVFLSMLSLAQTKTVHVLVALCDNKNQGIVPVPAKIGNGQDPPNNLYWGCGYGVKTFFKKQSDWKLIASLPNPEAGIYERVIFKHQTSDTYLIADAYDGALIKKTTADLLDYAAGLQKKEIVSGSLKLKAGGDADLICYVGHNGLMDFSLEKYPSHADEKKRDLAIFACASKSYFKEPVRKTGANPLIWTTHLMCPEAYTLVAAVNGWIKKDKGEVIRESVAQAYNKYHKCGIKGSRNLFATGW
ncbi:MAG: hypothetical protein K0S12_633 [Bacteroidetes bacterium]|jgi:hypothetical protein|nr:hypothetical protein [Bacteroidota bacterium]